MNVVFIRIYFMYFNIFTFKKIPYYLPYTFFVFSIYNLSSIFWCKNKMILTSPLRMCYTILVLHWTRLLLWRDLVVGKPTLSYHEERLFLPHARSSTERLGQMYAKREKFRVIICAFRKYTTLSAGTASVSSEERHFLRGLQTRAIPAGVSVYFLHFCNQYSSFVSLFLLCPSFFQNHKNGMLFIK